MTAAAFDVDRVPGSPQTLAGLQGSVIDHYEWLQITLGRFLAPARVADGTVEYLLLGDDGAQPDGATREFATHEVPALRDSLQALVRHLGEQIDSDMARSHVLASLDLLLSLHLPDPAVGESVHLRGGQLVLTRWGMQEGLPLGPLLGGSDGLSDKGEAYIETLAHTVRMKYDLDSATPTQSAASSDFTPAPPRPTPSTIPNTTSAARATSPARGAASALKPSNGESAPSVATKERQKPWPAKALATNFELNDSRSRRAFRGAFSGRRFRFVLFGVLFLLVAVLIAIAIGRILDKNPDIPTRPPVEPASKQGQPSTPKAEQGEASPSGSGSLGARDTLPAELSPKPATGESPSKDHVDGDAHAAGTKSGERAGDTESDPKTAAPEASGEPQQIDPPPTAPPPKELR